MIIRSQDKKSITTDLNLYIVHISILEPEFWEIKNSMGHIGTYSTEEKAIKVLDMICDACRNTAFIDEQAVIFNMPTDSEV